MKFYKVSFQYLETVFCSNIAEATNAADVEKHYSKYTWVNIEEATSSEVEAAKRKGMPIIKVEHIEEDENTENTESTETEKKGVNTMKNVLVNEIIAATAPHVLKSINTETGINWQKDFSVEKLNGRFTIRKIENIAAAAGYDSRKDLVIILTKDTACKWRQEFRLVTLENGKFNIDHGRCGSGSIYTNSGEYKSSPYSSFYTKSDLEETRKKDSAETYIIMQKAENISIKGGKRRQGFNPDERYILLGTHNHGDGHGNTYIGSIDIRRTTDHGSRAKYEANPGRYLNYNTMWRPATTADIIDKSGYLLHERRKDLERRATRLRAEKAAKAYQATDDREKVEEIRGMIENMKLAIIEAFKTANTYETIGAVEKLIDDYKTGLKWIIYSFEQYEQRTANKSYTSISEAERVYTGLKTALAKWQPAGKLESINATMQAGFNKIAAAATTTTATTAEA